MLFDSGDKRQVLTLTPTPTPAPTPTPTPTLPLPLSQAVLAGLERLITTEAEKDQQLALALLGKDGGTPHTQGQG